MASYVRYANQGATRNQPLSEGLLGALSFLPEMGVTAEVFSGGQPARGSGQPRVGSTRHDHGNAADVSFYKDGRRLDWSNPDDLPLFQEIVQRGKGAGLTGFGAGEGYMSPGTMHIGFGDPAVWGAGGKGANAPDWLRQAYNGAPTMSTRGQTTMRQPTQRPQPQGQPQGQPQEQKPDGILARMFPNAKEGAMDQIALSLMSMSSYPTPGMEMMMGGIQDRMKDRRETQKTEGQRNKTLERLQQLAQGGNPQAQRAIEFLQSGGAIGDALKMAFARPEDDRTSLIKNVEYLMQSNPGLSQEEALKMAKSGVTVENNLGGTPGKWLYGTDGGVPPGWRVNVESGEASRIPGGPAAAEAAANEQQAQGRQEQTERAGSTVVQDLQRGLDLIPELGALSQGEGVIGGLSRSGSANIPGTVANRITQFTESALSNVGLDTLQQMRENSPTGGALGQVPIQQQKRLEQVLGSLDITQPPSVLEPNMKRVMNIYTDIMHGTAEERRAAVESGKMSPAQNQEINSLYFDLPFDERGRTKTDDSGRNRLRYNPNTGDFE